MNRKNGLSPQKGKRPFACSAHTQIMVAVVDRLADVAEDAGHGNENESLKNVNIYENYRGQLDCQFSKKKKTRSEFLQSVFCLRESEFSRAFCPQKTT